MAKKLLSRSSHGVNVDVVHDGDRVVADWKQPGRRQILRDNAADSAPGRSHRKSDFMAPLARIPHLDREVLKKRNPELFESRKSMEKFLNSSEGKPYRVRPRGASRAFVWMGGKHGR